MLNGEVPRDRRREKREELKEGQEKGEGESENIRGHKSRDRATAISFLFARGDHEPTDWQNPLIDSSHGPGRRRKHQLFVTGTGRRFETATSLNGPQ